jgi:gluconolactonase
MALAPNGNVVLCQHGNRRIVELSPEMKVTVLVERSADGKHLSSPNDVVYTPGGSLYFTDPSPVNRNNRACEYQCFR